jgi:hypothetical protein
VDVVPIGREGKRSFLIDFGEDLDVQVVPIEDCCAWHAPSVLEEEYSIVDKMVDFIQPRQLSEEDIQGLPSLQYGTVYKAGQHSPVLHHVPEKRVAPESTVRCRHCVPIAQPATNADVLR